MFLLIIKLPFFLANWFVTIIFGVTNLIVLFIGQAFVFVMSLSCFWTILSEVVGFLTNRPSHHLVNRQNPLICCRGLAASAKFYFVTIYVGVLGNFAYDIFRRTFIGYPVSIAEYSDLLAVFLFGFFMIYKWRRVVIAT
jgi:hypothetical protein